jgi:D-lactate dehydrogenase (cytochrome)
VGAASGVPECLPASAACGIYLDIGTTVASLETNLTELAALIESCGGDPGECWSAMERDERERLRVFRHALPETVNNTIARIRQTHPTITKLGTDMAVPDDALESVVRLYREALGDERLDYVIFGHIGDNHLHVNILPRTPEEYAKGWELYHDFAEAVVGMGGSPAAEHGIGKLKTDFLEILYGKRGVEEMKAIKRLFDPELRLGRGTLFAQPG